MQPGTTLRHLPSLCCDTLRYHCPSSIIPWPSKSSAILCRPGRWLLYSCACPLPKSYSPPPAEYRALPPRRTNTAAVTAERAGVSALELATFHLHFHLLHTGPGRSCLGGQSVSPSSRRQRIDHDYSPNQYNSSGPCTPFSQNFTAQSAPCLIQVNRLIPVHAGLENSAWNPPI